MATNLKQVKRGYANLKRSGTQMYYETMVLSDQHAETASVQQEQAKKRKGKDVYNEF